MLLKMINTLQTITAAVRQCMHITFNMQKNLTAVLLANFFASSCYLSTR